MKPRSTLCGKQLQSWGSGSESEPTVDCKKHLKTSYSLKNHGVDEEVNMMFDMGAETMNLPVETKMEFEQGDEGMSFGYVVFQMSDFLLI